MLSSSWVEALALSLDLHTVGRDSLAVQILRTVSALETSAREFERLERELETLVDVGASAFSS